MSSILTNIPSYKLYFENIVTAHKKLAAYKYGTIDAAMDFLSSNTSGIESFVLWLEPYTANPKLTDDKSIFTKNGSLVILHPWEPGNYDNDTDAVYKQQTTLEAECEEIALDIISKIRTDFRNNDLYTDFSSFRYDTIDVSFAGNYVGIRLEFDYLHHEDICFKPENWN